MHHIWTLVNPKKSHDLQFPHESNIICDDKTLVNPKKSRSLQFPRESNNIASTFLSLATCSRGYQLLASMH
jgi:hypothetical protein